MSRFAGVQQAPAVSVFALTAAYKEDPNPQKVNAGVGAYRTDDGVPWVLPVVRQVENLMAQDESLNHEYLPIAGLPEFTTASVNLILGEDSTAILENKALGVQALSGTGALRLGADFLKQQSKYDVVYLPAPTWPNHNGIFKAAGFELRTYRYFKPDTKGLDFEGMMEDLKGAPENAVVVLHACAHNPTGVDPTQDQWKQIAALMKEKNLFTFFDAAYIGFATGSVDRDRWPVVHFVAEGLEMFISQSYSKNFGLYNERCGCLAVVVNNADTKPAIKSQLELIARVMWSNPPNHGARIVATALNNPTLHSQWNDHIMTMATRIMEMRQALYQRLKALGTPGTWNHIIDQIGMFSFTGLGPNQVEFMKKKHSVYAMKSGRMNMCALTTKNVDYVANAIHEAVTTVHEDPKL